MATKKVEFVEIKPIKEAVAQIRVVGDSPLVTHCWDVKAKRKMLENDMGITVTRGKEPKDPNEEFCSSLYWLTPMPDEYTDDAVDAAIKNGRFGFPVSGFKQAGISASYRMGWSKDKMKLRGAFFITPDADGYYAGDLVVNDAKTKIDIIPNAYHYNQMSEIKGDKPIMRMDMVTVGISGTDIRYRGEFRNWYVDMEIRYNTNGNVSLDQIINIMNAGGYCCGVGEMRPERDGQYGRYHIELMDLK